MIYLDLPAELLGLDPASATYWPTGFDVVAVEPAMTSRVLHLNDEQKFVFLDDALPLEVCFMTTPSVVARINWARIHVGLPGTDRCFQNLTFLTPVPDSPVQ